MLRIGGLALMAGLLIGASPTAARAAETLKIGLLKTGTVAWEVETIRRQHFDEMAGVHLETVELASNDADKVALLSGSVDVIVSDWIWVNRERQEGRKLVFVPFSTALGALVLKPGSEVKSLADLKGRKIGVAGGALDKSWLMLRAYARKEAGIDLATAAEPVYGAPPLLAAKLEQGELDAALLFWNFAAREEARGQRSLITMDTVEKALGAKQSVAMIGYVFDEATARAKPAAVAGLIAASGKAKALLKSSDPAWEELKPLMKAESVAEFTLLRDRFRQGLPSATAGEAARDARVIFEVLKAQGGEKLVGAAKELDETSFFAPTN